MQASRSMCKTKKGRVEDVLIIGNKGEWKGERSWELSTCCCKYDSTYCFVLYLYVRVGDIKYVHVLY